MSSLATLFFQHTKVEFFLRFFLEKRREIQQTSRLKNDAMLLKPNILFCGEALTALERVEPQTVQSIIADPPYGNVLLGEDWDTQWANTEAYLDWTRRWVSAAMKTLREDGLFFIFGQLGKREHGFLHAMSALSRDFQFHDLIIWDRVVGYNERRDSLTPCYEMILVLRKSEQPKFNKNALRIPYSPKIVETYMRDKRYKDSVARRKHLEAGKFATNIIQVPSLKGSSKEKCGHPSQKPLALIKKLITMSTDAKDIVLDPFAGSGTTLVAAQALDRLYIGIEKEKKYVSIAQSRLALS